VERLWFATAKGLPDGIIRADETGIAFTDVFVPGIDPTVNKTQGGGIHRDGIDLPTFAAHGDLVGGGFAGGD